MRTVAGFNLYAMLFAGLFLLASCSGNAVTTVSSAPAASALPQLRGFPDASNTGTHGTLTRYTGPTTITAAGTVIQNVEVDGCLTIGAHADNVVIENVLVRSHSCYWLILNDKGAKNLTVTQSELDGLNNSTGDAAIAGADYTLTRVNIHGTVDGGKLGNNVTVQDSYVHDLTITPDSHNDGFQSLGSVGVKLEHNSIVLKPGATSAVLLSTSAATEIRDVQIDNNLLGGGAFTIYAGYQSGTDDPSKVSDISITNNKFTARIFAKSGAYGPITSDNAPAVSVSNNTWFDGPKAGQPVS